MSDPAHAHLLDTWESCQQAVAWLRRSFEKSPEPPYEDVSADDWDQLEALSGRFARLTDLIVHKLLREEKRCHYLCGQLFKEGILELGNGGKRLK
jgi:hypothetical protein